MIGLKPSLTAKTRSNLTDTDCVYRGAARVTIREQQ
jgi:hypothetical protein